MTSGNPIFDKNLECIAKYNPKLTEKLLNLPDFINRFELVETELKEPNLSFNGLPLHSQENAENEAKDGFAGTINSGLSRHIVFGMGLGYLFKEACTNSKGIVFLYEPELEILRVTLEIVDFSKELSQPNVFVASDINNLSQLYSMKYLPKVNVSFLSLNSYSQIIYRNNIEEIITRVYTTIGANVMNYNTSKFRSFSAMQMIFKNLPYILNTTPLGEIQNIYKGRTAVVVAAGPSLDANIETIKKNRDNIVIFCIGQAYKALFKNGITPDFVNVIELVDCSGQLKEFDLSKINLITNSFTNNSIYQLKPKRHFLFPSFTDPLNTALADILDLDISIYDEKGTVAYEAICSAKIVGCSKIILVGQDLAYMNNQCYSKDSIYSDLVFDIDPETKQPKFKLKEEETSINETSATKHNPEHNANREFVAGKINITQQGLLYVKGVSGEMLPTLAGYANFIDFFSGFAYLNQELDLINSSMIGAQINGFKNIPLEEALKDAPAVKRIDVFKPFKYDKTKVFKNLTRNKNLLLKFLPDFNKAQEFIKKYEREMKLRGTTTKEAIKYIQALLALYEEISIKNDSIFFVVISYVEALDISSKLKENETLTVNDTKEIYNLLKNFFVTVGDRTSKVIQGLEAQEKMLNESLGLAHCE